MTRDVVVVLNFHGRKDTEACVASIMDGSSDTTVLVIDNGSHDGTVAAVRSRWPQIETIQNPDNLGFAGGMNTGLRWALDRGAKTVTVLNNDTIVPAGVLDRMVEIAQSGAIAVSPEVRYADGSERVWFGGGAIDERTGLARHQSDRELASVELRNGLRPSTILAGCCVTASARTWERVGFFDERYFLNFEDSDWSVRASDAGVALYVDPSVHIHHKVSASFVGGYSYLGLFYYTRNGLYFIRKRLGGPPGQAVAFARRHVVPALVHRARDHEWREVRRRSVVVTSALAAYGLSSYGRAPRWLERRASAWATASASEDKRQG